MNVDTKNEKELIVLEVINEFFPEEEGFNLHALKEITGENIVLKDVIYKTIKVLSKRISKKAKLNLLTPTININKRNNTRSIYLMDINNRVVGKSIEKNPKDILRYAFRGKDYILLPDSSIIYSRKRK